MVIVRSGVGVNYREPPIEIGMVSISAGAVTNMTTTILFFLER